MTARISPSVSPAPTHPSAPLHMLPPPSRGEGKPRRHSHFSHLTAPPTFTFSRLGTTFVPPAPVISKPANHDNQLHLKLKSGHTWVTRGFIVTSNYFLSTAQGNKEIISSQPPFVTLPTWTKWTVTGLLIPPMCHNHLLLSGGVGNEKVIISAS